jgi:hypothetical protein
VTDGDIYWTPADLLVHQDCDRELSERIVARAGRWVDHAADLEQAFGPDVTAVLVANEDAVLGELTARLDVAPEGIVDLRDGRQDAQGFGWAARLTAEALAADAPAIAGAAFETSGFRGTADLVIASEDGWVLADSRVSVVAPARAAAMLAALGLHLEADGLPVADHVVLLGARGVAHRWDRRLLRSLVGSRSHRVNALMRSMAAGAPPETSHDRVCEPCRAVVPGPVRPGHEAAAGAPPAAMRFPESRPGDFFLHVEYVHPAQGRGRPHVVLALATRDDNRIWWGEDRAHQVEQALEVLDRVREELLTDKKLHVFHRGDAVVRHLLRMTAGAPEAVHLVGTLLGRTGTRVLVDVDDAAAAVGAEADVSAPSSEVTTAVHAAYFAARQLEDRAASEALRQRIATAVVASAAAVRDLRDRVLELVGSASGSVAVLPPFEGTVADDLAAALRARAGFAEDDRTRDQEAWALVASALGYFARERIEFDRREQRWLGLPVHVWADDPDVLAFVEPPDVIRGPSVLKGHRNLSRGLEATAVDIGNLRAGAGSMRTVGRHRGQPGVSRPVNAVTGDCVVRHLMRTGPGRVRVSYDQEVSRESWVPPTVALIPREPPDAFKPFRAIQDLAGLLCGDDELPRSPAVDILARRPPRMMSGLPLPRSGRPSADLVSALQDLDNSYIAVQGPPGTGKTRLGASVVRRLVHDGWKVGVVAQSHAAVEHFLGRAVDQGLDPDMVVKARQRGASATGAWKTIKDVPSYLRGSTDGCLVGGTVWTFSDPFLSARSLDLLVVEEAGQLSLAHTMAAGRAGRNILLLGDPQQLPGVSEGVHDEPVDISPLEWLADGSPVIPDAVGYFLPTSFRMSPGVCERVSLLAYGGRLEAHASTADRYLKGIESGVVRVEVAHTGNRAASLEEATETLRQVRALIGTRWFDPSRHDYAVGLKEDDFLVVAPYNAQVNLIREVLGEAGLHRVRVGTVDRFQGQEAPVVLVSMASSSLDDTPRSASFLLDPRRLNVAVSRAQWMAIVICAEDLAHTIPSGAEDLEALSRFLSLADRIEG